jgi:hypothetical protein
MAKTITDIGRAECKALSEEATAALQRTLNKYGVTVTYGGGRYGGHTARLNFDLTVGGATGEAAASRDAEVLGAKFGIGFQFNTGGHEYEVTGFNLRRPKFPVSAKRLSDGANYKFRVEGINRQVAQGGN